ncbi:MAG: glycosyltransferase family 4 protein [Nitrosomonas sp.]|nr:glycosyltransferase family 4 protein [Nitrosomonas sp.]
MTKLCFAYPWATLGGCERVFINRALAFSKFFPGTELDFLFLSDSGGLSGFLSAIERYSLTNTTQVVESIEKKYDLVSLVDCPQLLGEIGSGDQRYMVECHTGYAQNRRYLANLPRTCNVVAAPSKNFADLIRREFPRIRIPIVELRNFVPWDIVPTQTHRDITLPTWNRRPIFFLGRLDKLKDPLAMLDAFCLLERRRTGEFMLLICGPQSEEIDINHEISVRNLHSYCALFPPVPFHSVDILMRAVARAGGIFVSTSHAESFGLSAAEAISSLIPVVLSDIEAHRTLVAGYEDTMTYQIGDVETLAERIEYVHDSYSDMVSCLGKLREKLSASTFIGDWNRIVPMTMR